jgi:methyl-accepting chemotaxis protein
MDILRNLKVGAKIIAGYVIALVLMLVVGSLAIIRLDQLNATQQNLTVNLSADRQLANDIVEEILLVRFYGIKYINTQNTQFLDERDQDAALLDTLMTRSDTEITIPDQVTIMKSIKSGWAAYKTDFEEIRQLIVDRGKVQAETLDVQNTAAVNALNQLRIDAFAARDYKTVQDAADLQVIYIQMTQEVYKYLNAGNAQFQDKFIGAYRSAQVIIARMQPEIAQDYQDNFGLAKTAIETYASAFTQLNSDYARQNDLQTNQLDVIGPQIRKDASQIVTNIDTQIASESKASDDMVTQTRWILLATMFGASVLGLFLGAVITRGITRPLSQVTRVAQQIADTDLQNLTREMGALAAGDLTRQLSVSAARVNIQSGDEIGQMGRTFNVMVERLQETGQAFGSMTANLQGLVGQVAENATSVGSAAAQLSQAANQAGEATSQISATIQQIATGNAQQSESVNHTAASVEQMTHAIDGVARGAQDQAASIARASGVTAEITAAIQQVAGNALAVSRDSAEAARAAREGVQTIQATILGMQAIKSRVDLSAAKVQEMGSRSDQIGAIVETIDDIASQTNLLALNAAIEAARAGEHGKGFAVVADEVRKLAERASTSTKEIGGLIKSIQRTVSEAVAAMSESASQVETGVTQANNSGRVLESILKASEAVSQQAEQATRSAEKMNVAANELVSAVDSVSAVIEENTAATEQMSAGAHEVTQAVENIASVSEENSASVEEVSASAEEMSAQVEEVAASATSLEEMAQALQDVVSQFKLSDTAALQQPARPAARPAAPNGSHGHNGNNGHNGHQPALPPTRVLHKA